MLTLAIMDAMQTIAAAVKLAYFRKTHDHIDHDTMLRAESVEKYLDNERRARMALQMAEEAKAVEAEQAATKAGDPLPGWNESELLRRCQAYIEMLREEKAKAQQAATKAGGLDADAELLQKARESIHERMTAAEAEARDALQERKQVRQEAEARKKPGAFGSMYDSDVFELVARELEKARARYPFWPADIVAAAAIASEESGEVIKATNEFYWSQGDSKLADIRVEAIQAIAMWVRFLTETPPVQNDQLLWNRQVQGKGDTLLAVFAAEELNAVRDADGLERQAQAERDAIREARELERGRVQAHLILLREQLDNSIDWLGGL